MWSPIGFHDRNEYNVNSLARNDWRASLVPAAAVIPAPIVYIKVVAVKKLVVGPVGERASIPASPRKGGAGTRSAASSSSSPSPEGGGERGFSKRRVGSLRGADPFRRRFTLNKLGCSKRAFSLRIR
jgi:hypothetical protein